MRIVACDLSTGGLLQYYNSLDPVGYILVSFRNENEFAAAVAGAAAGGEAIEMLEIVAHGTPDYCGIFGPDDESIKWLRDWINDHCSDETLVILSACNTGTDAKPTIADRLGGGCKSKVFATLGYVAGLAADGTLESSKNDWDAQYVYAGSKNANWEHCVECRN